ncbi:MAG: hypothetical protein FWD05_11165 [Oscillospiraceae bacterium]|nr:hypothetical protein [Oscillospiraceae bacterium]
MLRKMIIISVVLVMVLLLSACDTRARLFPPPDSPRLEWFDSVEDAIIYGSSLHGTNLTYRGEITRLIQNECNALYFIINPDERERGRISIYFFYVRNESGTTRFSRLITPSFLMVDFELGLFDEANLDDIGEIRFGVWSCRAERWYDALGIDIPQRYVWGISRTERVHNLAIEGQPVTEVIEFEHNGQTLYFWYFDDLQTDKSPLCSYELANFNFNVGEMDITMDELEP